MALHGCSRWKEQTNDDSLLKYFILPLRRRVTSNSPATASSRAAIDQGRWLVLRTILGGQKKIYKGVPVTRHQSHKPFSPNVLQHVTRSSQLSTYHNTRFKDIVKHRQGDWPSGLNSSRQVTEVKLGRMRSNSGWVTSEA